MSSKYLVSWIEGDDLGIYEAEDDDGAILAAVQDAGYSSLERAADFIYDENGKITLQAVEVEEWTAWEDGKKSDAVTFFAPIAGTFDIASAGASALGVDLSDSLNVARV